MMEYSRLPSQSALERHPDYAQRIGMVNIEINGMEITLGLLLGAILNIDLAVGQTIYLTPKSAFARLEILENVVNMLIEGGGHTYLTRMVDKAKAVLGKRHELVHGLWGVTDGKVGIYAVPVMSDDAKPKNISLGYLDQLIKDIRALVMVLHKTIDQLCKQHAAQRGAEPTANP